MARVLIVDCAPIAWEDQLEVLGSRSNAALFTDVLRAHEPDVSCHVLRLADGEGMPHGAAVRDFDGVVLTGSPLHAGDPSPEVRRQVDFAREVFGSDVPTWGSCWGLQLAAVALGGSVRTTRRGREIGVARGIALTAAAKNHAMLVGRPAVFDALCTHSDEVETLPAGAAVLAGNDVSAIQAATIPTPGGGGFWGVQYHPEIDLAYVAAVIRARATRLVTEGFGQAEADLHATADDYLALGKDPARRDLAWRYGIGGALLDPVRHSAEIGNWLRSVVLPRRTGRRPAAGAECIRFIDQAVARRDHGERQHCDGREGSRRRA